MPERKMLSIWFFVGLMLAALGLIITATGVYFAFKPQHRTSLAELNPSLWWGLIMLSGGLSFLIPSLRKARSEK
jgi:hypothetical protein